MAPRQVPDAKYPSDRQETDYERWLQDHDGHYQPAARPRYHPSHSDITEDDPIDQQYTIIPPVHPNGKIEKIEPNRGGAVVPVSRYGSITFPSEHHSPEHHFPSPHSSIGGPLLLRVQDPMIQCIVGSVFVIVGLLAMVWGFKMQSQGRQTSIVAVNWTRENEKKELI
ncbi:uncharacterized protein N7482_001231 [Penicillium canariense]|uniref:Uncharacterized protein n=1 Tax=Penicillium canariense TaxID=189055 RepID=A0A9W9LTQ0_9EURO|nr:uncharacterized protein N7482_001231 [Penicillium canariense]KAJ5175354.1 hypothetical protein N7482_001231 [Penicillium canariense]